MSDLELLVPEQTTLDVALLEDDPGDAQLFQVLLNQAWPGDVNIHTFETIKELEDGLTSKQHVIFTDLSVPDGRGTTVVERVVAKAKSIPVIVLTGDANPTSSINALELGAGDYLHKWEFNIDELFRSLRHCIARHHANLTMRRISADLHQANQDLDQIAGIIAHDLRAPLRTAQLLTDRFINAARRGGDLDPLSDALSETLSRMEVLVNRLMDMATLRDDQMEPTEIQVSELLHDVASALDADIERTGTSLTCVQDGTIVADRVLILQLIQNLVQNSIRYSDPERTPAIQLSTFPSSDNLWTVVQVVDNGIGIPEEYRERVFGVFEQLENHNSAADKGVGFGLAFCRKIAELHHGTIAVVDSEHEHGTAIEITLPAPR